MWAAIGQALPVAVGIAISSLPIVVVVLMIVTGPAAGADLAFLLGWVLGLGTVGAIVVLFADLLLSADEQPRWANLLRIVLGVAVLFLAVKQWRGRDRAGTASTPGWMSSLDTITSPRALGLGFALGSVNPKNTLLMISAGATVAAETVVVHEQVIALVVVVAVASAGVAAPVVATRVLGTRARTSLETLKAWLAEHNAVVMTVVLLVLGAALVGNGIAGLG